MMLVIALIAAVLVAATSSQLSAQPAMFRTGVELVPPDVCVTDRAGQYVPSLGPEDFAVFDDKAAQSLTFFSADGEIPLSVVLLLDRSSSMTGERLERAKSAAQAFLDVLRPTDRASVVAFNQSTSRVVPFGARRDEIASLVAGISAQGQTALFDAVLVGLRELAVDRQADQGPRREAIVILSDGEDSASRVDFDEVHREVQRAGPLIYSIFVREDSRDRRVAPHEFAQLANDTGGKAISVQNWAALETAYADIAVELRHMYRIAYVPAAVSNDRRWHAVTVRTPGRDLRVRTRAGYFAAPTRPRISQ